jgi:Ca-activated chloride channel homolog
MMRALSSPQILLLCLLSITFGPGKAAVTNFQNCEPSHQRRIVVRVENKDRALVENLKAEDLDLSTNKSPAQILKLDRLTNQPLAVAILIDTSRSQETVLEGTKLAARKFIQSVVRTDRDLAAVITFTGEATVEQDLTHDQAKLMAAIDRVKYGVSTDNLGRVLMGTRPPDEVTTMSGATALWDSLWATADDLFKSGEGRSIIVLLTDGEDTYSRAQARDVIEKAGSKNVAIFSLGIGNEKVVPVNHDALSKLSQETGGRSFFPKKIQELDAIFEEIEQDARSHYLVNYCLANPLSKSAPLKVKIEIRNPELRKQNLRLSYQHYAL